MSIFKRFLLFSCTLLAVTAFFTQAYAALSVTPNSAFLVTSGDENNVPAIENAIEEYVGDSPTLLYKYNTDDKSEDGSLINSYSTNNVILDSPNEATGLTISYDNGDNVFTKANDAYLLVKDGTKGAPAWYLFYLGADSPSWNGTEDLVLSSFWDGDGVNGSISHAAIYEGIVPSPVPVPSSAYLLGSALLLLPAALRRKQKRN